MAAACRGKECKGASEEKSLKAEEQDREEKDDEEEVAGSINITDEMKRMLNQL